MSQRQNSLVAQFKLQVLHCEENKRAEAKEYDTNAIGVYVTHERPDAENTLAGHVPIELTIAFVDLLLTSKR